MKTLNQAAIAVAVATLATVTGAQESHKVMEYLNLLDKDATVREAHATSPNASMAKYGLNESEQIAFLSADNTAVAKLAQIENRQLAKTQISNGHH